MTSVPRPRTRPNKSLTQLSLLLHYLPVLLPLPSTPLHPQYHIQTFCTTHIKANMSLRQDLLRQSAVEKKQPTSPPSGTFSPEDSEDELVNVVRLLPPLTHSIICPVLFSVSQSSIGNLGISTRDPSSFPPHFPPDITHPHWRVQPPHPWASTPRCHTNEKVDRSGEGVPYRGHAADLQAVEYQGSSEGGEGEQEME